MSVIRSSMLVRDLFFVAGLSIPLAGCTPDDAGVHPPLHLADTLAAAGGLREAPSASVGATRRYVLAELPALALGDERILSAGSSGALVTAVACDEAIAGRRLVMVFRARVPDGGMPQREWTDAREIRCPAGAEAEVGVTGLKPDALAIATVKGYLPPAPRVESDWLRLVPRSVLQLAIANADPRPLEQTTASRFSLYAETRASKRRMLLERTLDPRTEPRDRGWIDLRLDLDPVRADLGSAVRLVFVAEAATPDALAFPVWGDPTIRVAAPAAPAAPASSARRPSVILVSLDTLRADRLGTYGFRLPTSPNLDRVAAEGTLFEQAVAPANWTLPSHATMLTGLQPCAHGVRSLRPFARGVVPLAEILRREGYATAAFTEDGYVEPESLGRGFGLFRATTRIERAGETGMIEETFADATAWLRLHQDEDFFLFLHTYQVHAPYDPPAGYRKMFPVLRPLGAPGRPPPSVAAAADAIAYAAEVRYTDAVFGRLVADLAALGITERAILIVTSDHGEAFGEHGVRQHGRSLFEEELHVPLLWRAPGLIGAGRRVREMVGVVDVAPSVLGLLGIPAPPAMQGVSLAPILRFDGSGIAGPNDRAFPADSYGGGQSAILSQRWKAVFAGNEFHVFFLFADPAERHPQQPSPVDEAVRQAKAALDADCSRVRGLLGSEGTAREAPTWNDTERERKLRALGYVQ